MNAIIAALNGLSSAEEIFAHFELPFDPAVLNVNRLHILKRFNQYLARAGGCEGLAPNAAFETAQGLLRQAYEDFLHSTAAEQKVFRVFQGATRRIPVERLRGSRAP
jgi:nitrogenase-stabilizing/protective protein